MALLGGSDDKDKPKEEAPAQPARPNVGVGDIVLLQTADSVPVPGVVLGETDGVLKVSDLSGQYGVTYVSPKDENSDPAVLTWTARGGS